MSPSIKTPAGRRGVARALSAGLAAAGVALGLVFGAAGAATAQTPAAACLMYEDAEFRGRFGAFEPGDAVPRFGPFWNDRVSSVQVADGCRLRMFEHWDFGGQEVQFETDAAFVGRRFNDQFSAARCECGRAGRQGRDGGGQPERQRVAGGLFGEGGDRPQARADRFACVLSGEKDFRRAWRAIRPGGQVYELDKPLRGSVESIDIAPGCFAVFDVGETYKYFYDRPVNWIREPQRDKQRTVFCGCFSQ
ncbi:MAG: hypothetical protein AAFW46_09245 [Pseudomonadota bacterium]